MNYGNHN